MADEGTYYDGDDGMDFDGDWLYLEDEFSLADELAESCLPDPGYPGTNYEVFVDHNVFDDIYHFWDDLEYGHQEYWDYTGNPKNADPNNTKDSRNRKRRRIDASLRDQSVPAYPPIVYMTYEQQLQRRQRAQQQVYALPRTTLFTNWRTRFVDPGPEKITPMPAEMQKACGVYQELEEDGALIDTDEDMVDGSGSEDNTEEGSTTMGVDEDVLRQILEEKLEGAGLNAKDKALMLQSLTEVYTGGGALDDMAEMLTKALLGQTTEEVDEGTAGWLSKQGIELGGDDEEVDEPAQDADGVHDDYDTVDENKTAASDETSATRRDSARAVRKRKR